jgi:peroxiredoxin
MIEVGQRLPAATLREYVPEGQAFSLGPVEVSLPHSFSGRNVVIFGLPGAFTPACSDQHVPGFIDKAAEFRALGVDELWCVSVNDAFVMAAWSERLGTTGIIRMMADGSAEFTRALGLTLDLSAKGLGLRSQRYAMWVQDGVVSALHVDATGALRTSDAASLLAVLRREQLEPPAASRSGGNEASCPAESHP